MEPNRYTYLVTYSFDESNDDIRDNFRSWLKEGEYKAIFCDESTYGFSSDDSVGLVKQKIEVKLKELYDGKRPHIDDVVNLFCPAVQTDYSIRKDNSLAYLLHKIDQHHVLFKCEYN